MHMINSVPPNQPQQSNIAIFVSKVADITLPANEGASISYGDVPRTVAAQLANDHLVLVRKWLDDLQRPPDLSDSKYVTFICYCMSFFVHSDKLWCKYSQGRHKLVVTPSSRIVVLRAAHDDIGHKGFYVTNSLISLRFWWPHMRTNIAWFIRTCRLCQL